MNGIINIYKEKGYTSHDVVAKLRGICHQKKIGHTGTLDPEAEGVLLICLGNGTKLCDMLENKSKRYYCRMKLGIMTDTEDMTGSIISQKEPCNDPDKIRDVIMSFEGEYDQIPPMYSALKVNGKKLCDLARKGIEVERKSRKVNISEINIKKIELPYVSFDVLCSKGTYIRSLCRDIGNKLGCGAAMDYLRRTEVSGFNLHDALKLDEIKKLVSEGEMDDRILPLEKAFDGIESIYVSEKAKSYLINGNTLTSEDLSNTVIPNDNELFKVYLPSGVFAAVYRYNSDNNNYKVEKMFPDLIKNDNN